MTFASGPVAAALIAILLLLPAAGATFAAPSERSKQKQAAESERAELRQQLTTLKRDINQTEAAKDSAADALARSETAISNANRSLRELSDEQQQTAARIAGLSQEHTRLTKVVDAQNRQLSKLLREQYVAGNEDRIKLLLSGDNPNRINRELQYLGYVSQAQAKLIDSLRANLEAIEKNKADTQNAKEALDEIAQEEREQKAILEKEKAKRASMLSQLSVKLASQRKEAGNIEQDAQRLGALVDKLAKLIIEQQKADLAKAAARRQQEARARAERARAEQKRQASQGGKPPPRPAAKTPVNPDAIDADENPAGQTARNELIPAPEVQTVGSTVLFSTLRGQLRLPVRGELTARFGAARGNGPSWKGLFIRAAEGAEVKSVAAGRVVFAEWLRGFGNLIIVDHGSQYMTIYGNNQAVLKHPGDTVKAGDVIASAGNSGGNEQSGLYFEMRHHGRAFDPLGWVTIR